MYTLHSSQKINSKWITNLNVKGKTIKLLEDYIRENLGDPEYGDSFLDTKPKTWSIEEDKINILDFIKIYNVCSSNALLRE